MLPSYESIKFNIQTSKWAEETYFCRINAEKKSTDVHKVSLHLSTQAFNEIYSCLYKKVHLYFSKSCLYLSLRFNERIKTTNHTRLWALLKMLCISLTSIEILSPDFHSSFPRTTITPKLMNLLPTSCLKSAWLSILVHVSDSLNPQHLLLWPEQSVSFALGVSHPEWFAF